MPPGTAANIHRTKKEEKEPYDPQSQNNGPDQVGIGEKVEDGNIFIIEGNIRNSCVQRRFPLGYYEIMGQEKSRKMKTNYSTVKQKKKDC